MWAPQPDISVVTRFKRRWFEYQKGPSAVCRLKHKKAKALIKVIRIPRVLDHPTFALTEQANVIQMSV